MGRSDLKLLKPAEVKELYRSAARRTLSVPEQRYLESRAIARLQQERRAEPGSSS